MSSIADKQMVVRDADACELGAFQDRSVEEVRQQIQTVQKLMHAVMQNGQHYGVIPGTDNKPTLLKPGAEKLAFTFRLVPRFDFVMEDLGGGHREYRGKCTLIHQPTGAIAGEGVGSCSTMESKYRYRYAARKCPTCGVEAIIKGKEEFGGGWVCYKKKGGCGATFAEDEVRITEQQIGRVENEDLADTYNTILKMYKKRSLVDAIITACAASDIFSQDLEDSPDIVVTPPVGRKPTRSQLDVAIDACKKLHQDRGTEMEEAMAGFFKDPAEAMKKKGKTGSDAARWLEAMRKRAMETLDERKKLDDAADQGWGSDKE